MADANKQRSIPGSEWSKAHDLSTASRAVRECLATLSDPALGEATDVNPKFVSPSDPAVQWRGAMGDPAVFAYTDNFLIDVKCGIIMDVEASRAARQAEVGAASIMIDRTADRFGARPERLGGDTAYGSAEMLSWLVEVRSITPHVPVIEKSARRDGTFVREDFRYDHDSDTYNCPAGKTLTTSGTLVNDVRRFSSAEAPWTVAPASSMGDAVPTHRLERSHTACTKAPATSPVLSPALPPSSNRAASAGVSRCCSPT